MATIADDLTLCQQMLRDRTAAIWTRAELLRWYNDGLRRVLAESHGVRRLTVLALPPRVTASISYRWERRHVQGGTWRQWALTSSTGQRQCTYLWEVEQSGGQTALNPSLSCVTQLWELAQSHDSGHQAYRLALPKDHDRMKEVWVDHQPVTPLSTRAMDPLETAWNRQAGEPWVWVPGFGDAQSVELYPIQTIYSDAYTYNGGRYGQTVRVHDGLGHPRTLSGVRTYVARVIGPDPRYTWAYTTDVDGAHQRQGARLYPNGMGLRITSDPHPTTGRQATYQWEVEQADGATTFTPATPVGTAWWEGTPNVQGFALGLLRRAISPERQYMLAADWESPLGLAREWASSVGTLLVHEAVLPDVPDLEEDDTPLMIPAPLQKYLRYYVLMSAFLRTGEGFRPDLAQHYQQRWQRGPQLLRKLADITFADQEHQRQRGGRHEDTRWSWRVPFPAEYGVVER